MRPSRLGRTTAPPVFICQFCRLWLQQGRRFSGRPSALLRPLDKPKLPTKSTDDEPTVRWFEQYSRDGRPVPVQEDEMDAEATDLKSRIDRLEQELQEMKSGGAVAIPSLLAQLSEKQQSQSGAGAKDEEGSLTEKVALLQRLVRGIIEGKDIASDGSDNISRSCVRMATRREQKVYLSRLNGYLKQVEALGVDEDSRFQLWRWYVRCKQNIPHFLRRVSIVTWTTLWNAQSMEESYNPDRSAHLKTLAEDMMACGHRLSPAQTVDYIEAIFDEGDKKKAIELWHKNEEYVGSDATASDEFFALGVRMFAINGELEKAHKTAYSLLNDGRTKDARILHPVIAAWARAGGLIALRRAFAAYLRLREELGSDITMEDYDDVCEAFLDAKRADLALSVFRDMMLTGEHSSSHNSSALFRKALGTVQEIRSVAYDAPEINKVSLEAMTILPRRLQNKFFFGSWIKKLLGAGEPDSAALVVELMVTRGIQPDAKYLNGIIGAWMRRGDEKSFTKAESMAWAMVELRKEFAWRRRAAKRGDVELLPAERGAGARAPNAPAKCTTVATLETFSLLMDYYLDRHNHDQIRWLHRCIRLAEVEPDAFFMRCLLQSQLKTDGLRKVWQTYAEWAHKQDAVAKPNAELYDFLWSCALLRAERSASIGSDNADDAAAAAAGMDQRHHHHHYHLPLHHNHDAVQPPSSSSTAVVSARPDRADPVREQQALARKQHGFPSPRALFSDMMAWLAALAPKQRAAVRAPAFPRTLYMKVLRALLEDGRGDLAGALVALHALHEHFGTPPDETALELIVVHVAKADDAHQQQQQQHRGRPRHTVRPRNRLLTSVGRVTQRLRDMALDRLAVLESHGIDEPSSSSATATEADSSGDSDGDGDDEDEDDARFRQDENLLLVSNLLRKSLARNRDGDDAEVNHVIQRASWDMGVGGMDTGDHLERRQ